MFKVDDVSVIIEEMLSQSLLGCMLPCCCTNYSSFEVFCDICILSNSLFKVCQ